jgi:hypothetical protein
MWIRLKIGENVDEIMVSKFTYPLWAVVVYFDWNFHPEFPEIYHSQNLSPSSGWIGPKFGQKVAPHFTLPKYNLDHPNPLIVARGTAGSVNSDGPSMPSEDCSSSCSSTTHPITLL